MAYKVVIVDYRPEWARQYSRLAQEIRTFAGPLAARIDHIGSTSVPGLAAKDLIDIQLSVESLDCVNELADRLHPLQLEYMPEYNEDHIPPGSPLQDKQQWTKAYFRRRGGEITPDVNLHVRVRGSANQRYALLFRDFLRADPLTAAAYAELKRRIAHHHPDSIADYIDIKDPAFDLIMGAAEMWARHNGWQPPL